MIEEIERRIRAGTVKFNFNLYPGTFISELNKQCCVIGALQLYCCDEVPYSEDDTDQIAVRHAMTCKQALALESGFENWGESNNTRQHPELYQLGMKLRSEVIRVELEHEV